MWNRLQNRDKSALCKTERKRNGVLLGDTDIKNLSLCSLENLSSPVPMDIAAVMAHTRSSQEAKRHMISPKLLEKLVPDERGSPVLISNFEIPWNCSGERSAKS